MKKAEFFNESIRHFTCGKCGKWFAIGDAPHARANWHCPWCGVEQVFEEDREAH